MLLSTDSNKVDALAKDNRDGIRTQQGEMGGGDQCALPWWGDVCVVALGLRTAFANARVKPFGRGCVRTGLIREQACSVVRGRNESAISWL